MYVTKAQLPVWGGGLLDFDWLAFFLLIVCMWPDLLPGVGVCMFPDSKDGGGGIDRVKKLCCCLEMLETA